MIKVVKVVKLFFLQSKFYHLGDILSALAPGLCACIKLYKSLNVFFSETSCHFSPDFTCWPSVKMVLTICSNGFALLNKMAAMPIYSKNTPEPRMLWGWILVYSIGGARFTNWSHVHPRMTIDLFTTLSNFCPICCGNVAWYLQICSGCFTQVSESWPVGLLFLLFHGLVTIIIHSLCLQLLLFSTDYYEILRAYSTCCDSRPQWLSWMRRPTGDQEVAGSTPAEVGNILSWRLIMKYFLRSFSPFRWFKKGSCQFLAKDVHNTG